MSRKSFFLLLLILFLVWTSIHSIYFVSSLFFYPLIFNVSLIIYQVYNFHGSASRLFCFYLSFHLFLRKNLLFLNLRLFLILEFPFLKIATVSLLEDFLQFINYECFSSMSSGILIIKSLPILTSAQSVSTDGFSFEYTSHYSISLYI